ncbi:AP-4 complex accessory subunit RUSC1 [Boleophthalmus pectinirostris]|uniref:AP-4 complex accessory subunit RUSC1 n=1 Tax=Boleophthalmus pectinirostris TaxID=150288 RepID=UPI00242EAECD|nr:AP-4 complex accessory subunit RUSC1 [Boleophthalmus pectinirostris]
MDHDVRAPVRGLGLSPQTLQEKRALVSAVSVAVEAILAQFSTSRTIVQKALSGDSTVNPSLGRLVLQCLCPALHSLLTDGLRPHQSDLIAGRRPNNAWGLIQASTRPGSKTQALHNLQTRVGDLPQLKQSKHRFNAFILGLLNIKHLDFWLSHLHTSSDVLETYYHPSSFMRLSLSACHAQFEELLLVLQPLSLLTFNLDLLFQHHHVDPHNLKTPSAAGQDAAPHVSNQTSETKQCEEKYMESLSEEDIQSGECRHDTTSHPNTEDNSTTKEESLLETSPQLRWVKEKEISSLPPPNIEEDSLAQQAGQVIQQGWEVMVRWGGRLSQNLSEMSAAAGKKEEQKTEHLQAHSDFVPVSSSSSGGAGIQMLWGLDRLFGAPKSSTSPGSHPAPTRRPSQWLAPGVSALTRMVSSSTAPMLKKVSEPKEETSPETQEEAEAVEMKDQPRPLRSVRTLCDHRGTGGELSFNKDEELQVLGGVDQDWIRCRRGNTEGLVPIGYTSLIM